MKLPKLSVRLHGGMTPTQCVEQAQAADAAGMHGVWFAENPFNRGTLPAAVACAVATKTLQIGAGVFNPYNRHPTLIAMEIGALDDRAVSSAKLMFGIAGCAVLLLVIAMVTRRVRHSIKTKLGGPANKP